MRDYNRVDKPSTSELSSLGTWSRLSGPPMVKLGFLIAETLVQACSPRQKTYGRWYIHALCAGFRPLSCSGLLFLGSCFGLVFGHFLENCSTNFGDPFWDQMGLRWAKMGSKRPIKSFKVAKTCICKNLEKTFSFQLFLGFQGRPR